MLQVNFLPWRERQRKRASKRFSALVAGYAAVSAVSVAFVYGFQLHRYGIDADALRAIEEASSLVQARIEQAAALQKRLDALNATVEQIERYRQSASDVSRRLLAIETTLPEALWLKRVAFQDGAFTISGQGWAESDVVEYLQGLESSLAGWRLRLSRMTDAPEASRGQTAFTLEGRRLEGERKEVLP